MGDIMRLTLLAFLACAIAWSGNASELEELVKNAERASVQVGMGGTSLGVKYWRVRSIVGGPGEWAVLHLNFYDSHAADAEKLAIPEKECTGHEEERGEEIPTACMLASSTKLVPKEDPEPDNPDKTAANLEPDKPHPTPNAFKDDDSYWMSATKHKDEW